MRILPILAAVLGVAVMAILVGYFGAGAVTRSLLAVGATGFIAICAVHLAITAVMGLGWRALLPGADAGKVIWARLMRDSGSEALPLSQVGGYVLWMRALALAGVSATRAAASTIVDVTLEFIAQLVYTALGLALLVRLQPETQVAAPVLLGLSLAILAAVLPTLMRLTRRQIVWTRMRTASEICRSCLALWSTPTPYDVVGQETVPELAGMLTSLNYLKMSDRASSFRPSICSGDM